VGSVSQRIPEEVRKVEPWNKALELDSRCSQPLVEPDEVLLVVLAGEYAAGLVWGMSPMRRL
jgi:hypothetical protein